jgi:hypothetical protein
VMLDPLLANLQENRDVPHFSRAVEYAFPQPEGNSMAISMYQASAPRFANMLKNLSRSWKKRRRTRGEEDRSGACCSRAASIPTCSRCAPGPDRVGQRERRGGAACRRRGAEVRGHRGDARRPEGAPREDGSTFVESFKPAQIDGSEENDIHLKLGPRK